MTGIFQRTFEWHVWINLLLFFYFILFYLAQGIVLHRVMPFCINLCRCAVGSVDASLVWFWFLCMLFQVLQFTFTPQNYAGKWIGSRCVYACAWGCAMFKGSWNRLWIHCDPEQNEAFTVDEWMNNGCGFILIHRLNKH